MTTAPVLTSLESRKILRERFRDNALLLYALEMRFALDDVVTEGSSCITDGYDDRKCDLLYINRDMATAVIGQGYFSTVARQQAPSSKAADLNTAVTWVIGGQRAHMNESLAAAAEEFHLAVSEGEVDNLELWYCHNLPESDAVASELERAAETAKALLSIRYPNASVSVKHLEVGLRRLSDWYQSLQSPILVPDNIDVKIDGWFEEVGSDWTAVCTSVPAVWLASLHEKYEDRLYSANVRGYMPSRRMAENINHNIQKTARERPGHFWAFNNGITGLVHDYDAPQSHDPGQTLRLHGLAIINGAQTTGSLSKSGGQNLEEAFVLARFVRCSNRATIDDLIRFNNSQNPIRPSDFRSTDRHQERLKQQFQIIPDAVYFGARRGGQQDRARRPSNLVPSDTVAQCLAAFHGEPGTAYHNLRGIWEDDKTYSTYFSDFTTAPHVVFVYSLLTAIQEAKADLVSREINPDGSPGLAVDEGEILSFFRQRGSQFLLMAAVSSCLEIILSLPIPYRFRLSFGNDVSPSTGAEYWSSVIEALLPFAHTLRADELKGSLKTGSRIGEVIAAFRASVRSTARSNEPIFSQFRAKVRIG